MERAFFQSKSRGLKNKVNAFTSNASLIIHPEDPDWFPDDINEITTSLRNAGLIAGNIPDRDQSYFVGDNFLELIAFMGCSPNITLTPQDNSDKFCFIRLIKKQKITALTSQHTHAPHCPYCKKPEKNWSTIMTNTTLACTFCGAITPPWDYNWRKSAGFGRFFIEITEIYPKEAIPQQGLLSSLEQHHDTSWGYFYLYS